MNRWPQRDKYRTCRTYRAMHAVLIYYWGLKRQKQHVSCLVLIVTQFILHVRSAIRCFPVIDCILNVRNSHQLHEIKVVLIYMIMSRLYSRHINIGLMWSFSRLIWTNGWVCSYFTQPWVKTTQRFYKYTKHSAFIH